MKTEDKNRLESIIEEFTNRISKEVLGNKKDSKAEPFEPEIQKIANEIIKKNGVKNHNIQGIRVIENPMVKPGNFYIIVPENGLDVLEKVQIRVENIIPKKL